MTKTDKILQAASDRLGEYRGDLPKKENEIYCALLGGPDYKPNYLRSSCRVRLRMGSCTVKGCEHREGE